MKKWRIGDWRFLILTILAIALCFRFVNLDKKVYWQDETSTSLRISGYGKSEFYQKAFNGEIITVGELHQKYQVPNADKTWNDTLTALMDKSEHPPLYYLMARFWAQLLGGDVAVMRSLPALISLLAFPAMYWLCWELFQSSLVAWIAIAFIAVSPIHVLYAQEARQYSLWIVSILFSSAALLQAMRKKTGGSWGIYALSLSVALYSNLLSGLVAIAHGIYVFVTERFRISQTAIGYAIASLAALITFLPWLWVVFFYSPRLDSLNESLADRISVFTLIGKWFRSINRVFHDADLGSANVILVLLVAYSFYFVSRHNSKRVWLFIFTLFGVTAFTLGVPDLIWGGERSLITRYLIPCALSIELAMAYLLAAKLINSPKIWQQQVWKIVAIALISAGTISGFISLNAETWWHKNDDVTKYYPKIARSIQETENPLVISDGSESDVLSLSHLLKDEVNLLLVKPPTVPAIPEKFDRVFLFDSSETLREKLEQKGYGLEAIVDKSKASLWEVIPFFKKNDPDGT